MTSIFPMGCLTNGLMPGGLIITQAGLLGALDGWNGVQLDVVSVAVINPDIGKVAWHVVHSYREERLGIVDTIKSIYLNFILPTATTKQIIHMLA